MRSLMPGLITSSYYLELETTTTRVVLGVFIRASNSQYACYAYYSSSTTTVAMHVHMHIMHRLLH